MRQYRAKAGWNQALVDLVYIGGTTTRFDPRSNGFQWPESLYGISQAVFSDGSAFVEWEFRGALYADLTALDTLFGTSITTRYANVTIYTLKEKATYARCNATVERPLPNAGYTKGQGGLFDMIWRFTGLVEL